MEEFSAIRQMLVEVLGGEEEAEFELAEYLSGIGTWEDLISFSGGREDHQRFRDEWNKRYPRVPVRVKWNDHDFGGYWSIEVWFAEDDREEVDIDVEDAAVQLADELGLEY